jgi:hypothetical protein
MHLNYFDGSADLYMAIVYNSLRTPNGLNRALVCERTMHLKVLLNSIQLRIVTIKWHSPPSVKCSLFRVGLGASFFGVEDREKTPNGGKTAANQPNARFDKGPYYSIIDSIYSRILY